MAHLARGGHATTAVGSGLVSGDVLGAGHALAGAGLIAGDLFGTADFIAGDAVAVAGGGDAHLGRSGGSGSGLTEGLEDFGTQVLGTGDRTAGAGLVTGGFHRAVGLGAGHGLATGRGAFTHLPVGISGSGLLGAVAVGTGGAGHTSALLVAGTGLGAQLTHLLCELTAGEVRVGLTGNGCCTGGLLASGFAVLRHGFTTGQHQRAAGVLDGTTLGSGRTALCAGRQLGSRCTEGSLFSGTLATATTALGGFSGCSSRSGCLGLTGNISAVAIAAGVGGLTAAGQGITTGEHQLAAGIAMGLDLGAAVCGSSCEGGGPLRSYSSGGGRCRGRLSSCGRVGAGGTGISNGANTVGAITSRYRGLLTGSGQRLAAFKCEFATGESCHVRPRMSS